jgi:hypothetical protein
MQAVVIDWEITKCSSPPIYRQSWNIPEGWFLTPARWQLSGWMAWQSDLDGKPFILKSDCGMGSDLGRKGRVQALHAQGNK